MSSILIIIIYMMIYIKTYYNHNYRGTYGSMLHTYGVHMIHKYVMYKYIPVLYKYILKKLKNTPPT